MRKLPTHSSTVRAHDPERNHNGHQTQRDLFHLIILQRGRQRLCSSLAYAFPRRARTHTTLGAIARFARARGPARARPAGLARALPRSAFATPFFAFTFLPARAIRAAAGAFISAEFLPARAGFAAAAARSACAQGVLARSHWDCLKKCKTLNFDKPLKGLL